MRIDPEFPSDRASLPERRAEHTIYQLLAESAQPGRALYEARPLPDAREVDFAIWLPGAGRFAVEVKGGTYATGINGRWRLVIPRGRFQKPSPLSQAREAATGLEQALEQRLRRKVDILPVVALPDMEPDDLISHLAALEHVAILYGTLAWVERLATLAAGSQDARPPTGAQIEEEVRVVMPGL